jgi:hypothetical protein
MLSEGYSLDYTKIPKVFFMPHRGYDVSNTTKDYQMQQQY